MELARRFGRRCRKREGPPAGVHDLQRRGVGPARLERVLQAPAVPAGGNGGHVQPRHGAAGCAKRQGTSKDNVLVEGSGHRQEFDDLIETLNKKYDFALSKKADRLPANSDHFSFYKKKVPVLFFWTGFHPDYHKPSDTADKINVAGCARSST